MRISKVKWPAIFISCLLCLTEEAILRPYRRLSSILANVSTDDTIKKRDDRLKVNGMGYPLYSAATSNFQPTPKRCCQIGERVAKKKMVCDITMLAVVRKYNYEKLKYSNQYQYSNRPIKYIQRARRRNKLSEKIAKCSALHPKYFVKCCSYKEEFYKHMKKCQLRPKRQRRRCKHIIRRKYLL